jgi:predicted phosphodiesterase
MHNPVSRMIRITFIILCAVLVLYVLVLIISYGVGRYIYSHALETPEAIPFINNRNNTSWIEHQPPRESFSFLVLGDIQGGFRTLSQHIFKKSDGRYSFAIQTGDLMSHADEGHYAQTLYEVRKSNLHIPLFVVPGNHDINGKDPRLFEKYFAWKQFYFLWSNCLFIFLDNSSSPPYYSQFHWLEKTLEENHMKARRTFIFMHRGPVECGGGKAHRPKDDFTPFFALLKKYRIDYVFCGHVHDYLRMELQGTMFVANGAESELEGFTVMPSYVTLVEVTPEKISDQKITMQVSLFERMYGKMLDNMVAHIYPRLVYFSGKGGAEK